jgi:ubiquinone/menaquinone biosynthesis C-methylase UbiE
MSDWAKKRRVTRRYDQSARVYDVQYYEEQNAKISKAMENLTLNKDSKLLDVGCGTGLLFEHVAEKTRFTIGTDSSRGLLKEAKKKARPHENVALILADADNMPFANNTFDTVFAITLLQNMPHVVATLDEIKRVSRSEATIVVSGLRKAFTEDEFSKMLKRADLKAAVLKLDEQHREYIAVCLKTRR